METKKLHVLIVEDSAIKERDIEKALNGLDILDIAWVKSLQNAKNALSARSFDLIVCDMCFPNQDYGRIDGEAGSKVLDYIKENHIDTPVIYCSTMRLSFCDELVLGTIQYDGFYGLMDEFKIILSAYEIIE